MNTREINTWWKKGIEKERARLTNAPTHHKGDKFSVATNFSSFAPEPTGKVHASQRRSS